MNDTSHDHTPELGWGTSPDAAAPTTPDTAPSSGWSTVRRVLLWVVVAVAVPGIAGGMWMVLDDLEDTSDMFHGLGIALGLLTAVPCLVAGTVAGFGLRAMHRQGSAGGRGHAATLGGLFVLPLALITALGPMVLLPALLGGLLLTSVYADQEGRA